MCYERDQDQRDVLENLLRVRRSKSSGTAESSTSWSRREGESAAAWEARETSWTTSALRGSRTFKAFLSELVVNCPFIVIG